MFMDGQPQTDAALHSGNIVRLHKRTSLGTETTVDRAHSSDQPKPVMIIHNAQLSRQKAPTVQNLEKNDSQLLARCNSVGYPPQAPSNSFQPKYGIVQQPEGVNLQKRQSISSRNEATTPENAKRVLNLEDLDLTLASPSLFSDIDACLELLTKNDNILDHLFEDSGIN